MSSSFPTAVDKGPLTLLDKLWSAHRIVGNPGGEDLLWVDLNLVHEGGTFLAFDQLEAEGRSVRTPGRTLAVTDHYLPTRRREEGLAGIDNPEIREVVRLLSENAARHRLPHVDMHDARQGIVHVIAPELGLSHPGLLIVCCDSHTATQGAFGTLALPIGQSNQLRHVLATQTLWMRKPRNFRIRIEGELAPWVGAKDVILHVISRIGIGGAVGHAIEYCGSTVRAMTMEARMTLCNMSVEAGARIGLIAPDQTTFDYLHGRPHAPAAQDWEAACASWRTLPSDPDARFDRELAIDATAIEPMVSWGTSPEDSVPIGEVVPDPARVDDPVRRDRMQRALAYTGLSPGQPLAGVPIDRVFIGSCTNARIEDLRVAARVLRGRRVVVPVLVVPGSSGVRRQAQCEGLDRIFLEAGCEWGEAGCSMCGGANGDLVAPGQRCASTTNRNFEGRQGPGAITHILSPALAAASAVRGALCDVRTL